MDCLRCTPTGTPFGSPGLTYPPPTDIPGWGALFEHLWVLWCLAVVHGCLAVVHGCRRSGSCPSGPLPERCPRDEERSGRSERTQRGVLAAPPWRRTHPPGAARPHPGAPRAPGAAPSALPGPRAPRGLTSAHFGRRSSAHLNAHMVRSI
eukprot:gene17941-biopygen18922